MRLLRIASEQGHETQHSFALLEENPTVRISDRCGNLPTQCALIKAAGCTVPARPNEMLMVRYGNPAGNPFYHEVKTDQFGYCEDPVVVVIEGCTWNAAAYYPRQSVFRFRGSFYWSSCA